MAKKNIDFNTYVKRDLNKTTVDWGTVASKLSTDLLRIRKEREDKRAELEARYEDDVQTVNTQENYTNRSLQDLALGMSGESANFLRVQNDLFKNGQITQTELAQGRQRVLGDWAQFGNVSKKWESDYASMKNRIDGGEGSSFESWFSKQNAQFGNLNDVQGFVNPTTGRLSLIRRNEDGSFPTDPSQFVSMNVINNRFSARVDNVTYNGGLTKKLNTKVDSLGELILTEIKANGEVFSIEGQQQALQTDGIQAFLNETAAQYTVNDNSVFSILGDINGNYSPTDNVAEAEADPYKVLIEYDANGVPVPVKEGTNWDKQVKAAREIIKDKMILMLDRKESGKPGDVYSEYEQERLRLERLRLNKLNTPEVTDEDTKYRPANYSGNSYGKFGKDVDTTAMEYITKNLGQKTSLNKAKTLAKTFKNAITGTLDSNILLDLNEGKYPEMSPLDFQYDETDGDFFTVKLGDKDLRWPPIENIVIERADGTRVEIEGIGENRGMSYGIYDNQYNSSGLIFDFLKQELINPVTEEFINLQEKNRADSTTDPFGNAI